LLLFARKAEKKMELHFIKFRPRNVLRSGKLAVWTAALLGPVLGASFVFMSPALASSVSLPTTAGHTCQEVGKSGGYEGVVCVELAVYYSQTSQKNYITAQTEGVCTNTNSGAEEACNSVSIAATVANGGGFTDWGDLSCGDIFPTCSTPRTYLFPYGGIVAPPKGKCMYNLWAAIEPSQLNSVEETFIGLPSQPNGSLPLYLASSFGTAHFDACTNAGGQVFFYSN
jgi:hypothetical protein